MKKIYFFEVKDDEEKYILEKYPEASCFREAFSKENVSSVLGANILCGMVHSDFSRKNLSNMKNLELIVTRSAGYNHIDMNYCRENNIQVARVPDYGSHVIAEHVFALMLAVARNILSGEKRILDNHFFEDGLCGISLKGKILGIIGLGKIGAHVARIASRGFLMNVLAFDPYPKQELAKELGFVYVEDIDEIYEKSDIITLHLPLLPSTKHIINKKSIKRMKDGVMLINTSRGGLICTEDLVSAIKSGKFSHVALDVVEHENNIKEVSELVHLDKVLMSPHLAYYTKESVHEMYRIGFQSIDEYLKGKPLSYKIKTSSE